MTSVVEAEVETQRHLQKLTAPPVIVNKGSSSDGLSKSKKPEKSTTEYKKRSTRQSMIVKPGESRRRRFTFDGFQRRVILYLYTVRFRYGWSFNAEEVYVAMAAVGITP